MRRIVLVLVIVIVLGLIAGGGWWYLHRNSGEKRLGRAELALRAQKYDRALELARAYTADNPKDWRGYYVQAQGHTASGRYEEARRLLDDAAEIAPDQPDILFLRSDTYANPARETLRTLAVENPDLPLEQIRAAVDQLIEAKKIIEAAYPAGEDRPPAAKEALGLLLNSLGRASEYIKHRFRAQADTLDIAKQEEEAREARAKAEEASQKARQYFREASRVLLQAVTETARGTKKEPAALPRRATNVLVEVCSQYEDTETLSAVADLVFEGDRGVTLTPLVLESKHPPLVAVATLVDHRLGASDLPPGSAALTKERRQACEQLDALLEDKDRAAQAGALQIRLVRARLAMDLGNLDAAESIAGAILEDLPHQRNARLLLALIAMEQGEAAAAEDKLLALKTDFPHWQAARIFYARAALETGNRERAREALRRVTEEQVPRNPQAAWEKQLLAEVTQARLILAQSLLKDGLAEQALNETQQVLKTAAAPPQAIYLHFWSAVCAGRPGLGEEAVARGLAQYPKEPALLQILLAYPEFLEAPTATDTAENEKKQRLAVAHETLKAAALAVLAKAPANPNALALRVRTALATGEDPAPVLAALRKAAKARPEDRAVQAAVADGYRALGKPEEALAAAERVAAGTPETLRDQILAAQAHLRLGRTAEAERTLRDAVDSNPHFHRARALLAEVYLRTRRTMQAIEQLREAVSLAPAQVPYRLTLARALLQTGLIDEADDQVQTVLSHDPDNADAVLLSNQIQVLRGGTPDAEEQIEASLAGRSGRPLAQAYLARGNPEKCIEICRSVLKASPDDAATRWLLARALLVANDRPGCIDQLTETLKASPDLLPIYQSLAIVLGADRNVTEVETALAAIPGARKDLIHLASATLLEQQRQYEAAAEAYGRVVADTDSEPGNRIVARLHKARCLAAAGHADLAIVELDRIPDDHPLHARAALAKAALLAQSGRQDEANKTLQATRKAAVAGEDLGTLGQAAALYLQWGEPDEAVAVAQAAVEIAPKNPQPLLLRAAALDRLGRSDEVVDCLRQAVVLQPGNLGLHSRLARALDKANRRLEALQALSELEKQGRTGEVLALFERGRMLLGWGLQKQAVETLSNLADRDLAETPRVRLLLGRALAVLGQKDQAREQLAAVPVYSPVYAAARQLLARLAETTEEKLAILQAAESENPEPALTAQRITVLLDAGRPGDAVKALEAYLANQDDADAPPLTVAMAGIRALLQSGQEAQAADLATRVAVRSGRAQVRHVAVLLALRTDPAGAADLLPPPERAGLADTLLGLSRAVLAGADPQAWAQRLSAMRAQAAEADPPVRFPLPSGILGAVAAGDWATADRLLGSAGAVRASGPEMVRELIQTAKADAAGRKEAAALLASSMAIDAGLFDLGRAWALELLRTRPASQWAASVAARDVTDPADLRRVIDLLQPDDCITARVLRMSLRQLEGQFDDAAKMARELADAHQEHPELVMAEAGALERAGRLEDALARYKEVWQRTQDPAAANNAAYLTSSLYPKDAAQLRQAATWSEAAVKAAPQVSAFHDTRGWIAYLLGQYEEARTELLRATRGIPTEPEVHYHLGLAESKTGHAPLARWHLETAVDLAQAAETDGEEGAAAKAKAGRLAREALAELKGSQTP